MEAFILLYTLPVKRYRTPHLPRAFFFENYSFIHFVSMHFVEKKKSWNHDDIVNPLCVPRERPLLFAGAWGWFYLCVLFVCQVLQAGCCALVEHWAL